VTTLGRTSGIAIAFFLLFILVTLGITAWAANKRAAPASSTLRAAA
jgi:hypothetical protein